jgi:hypothetical protein
MARVPMQVIMKGVCNEIEGKLYNKPLNVDDDRNIGFYWSVACGS